VIGTLIIVGSIAFAAAFAVAWWLRPTLRRVIEAPKHGFADRVRQYDEAAVRTARAERRRMQHE
jgi:hypothetical protein